MRHHVRFLLAIGTMLALAGCDLIVNVDRPRHASIIAAEPGYPAPVQAPDTVQAGTPFEVTVTTVGPTTCWESAGADVEIAGGSAEIVPYDRETSGPRGLCPQAIVFLQRTVTLEFSAPGEVVIRVIGRSFDDRDHSFELTVQVA